jgi:hypothetical protein
MEKEVLNRVLLPLADQFESGNRNRWCTFKPGEVNEYEKLRECMAELVAEKSAVSHGGAFQLSQSGYTKYLHRIRALRVLNASAGQ